MLKSLMAGAALALIATVPAHAAVNTALIMWNGLNATAATGVDTATIANANLGGVTVSFSFAARTTNPNQLTEGNINIDNTTNSVQTLNIIAGANGFLGTAGGFDVTGTFGVTSGKADLAGAYYIDTGNSLNGLSESVVGTQIDSFDSLQLVGPKSFSFNDFASGSVSGPYGLVERLTLTLQPGTAIFVQGVSMTAVPEPKTWAMMGLGFALLGLVARAKSKRAVAA